VGSAQDYIASTNAMISVAGNHEAAQKSAEVALRLASATGMDAASSTKALADMYSKLGDPTKDVGSEMSRLADIMTTTQKLFAIENVAAMPEAFTKVVPAAKMTGTSLEQVAASIGALERAGLKGEGAGAALGEALKQMGAASKAVGFDIVKTSDGGMDFVATLANLQAKVGDVKNITPDMQQKLAQAFGAGNEAVLALLDNSKGLGEQLTALEKSTGATANAAKLFETSGAGAAQVFEQQLAAVKMQLAAGIMPAIGKVIPYVSRAAEAIGKFAAENPKLVALAGTIMVGVTAFGLIGGPILSAVGAVMSFGGALAGAASKAMSFFGVLLANPIGLVIAAIAAVVILIWKWDTIVPWLAKLWERVKAVVIRAWEAIKAYVASIDWAALWARMQAQVMRVWNDIAGFLGSIDWSAVGQRIVGTLLYAWANFHPLVLLRRGLAAAAAWMRSVDWSAVGKRIVDTLIQGWSAVQAWASSIDLNAVGKRVVDGIVAWFRATDFKAEAVRLVSDFMSVWQAVNLTFVWEAAWAALVSWWRSKSLVEHAQSIVNGANAVWRAVSFQWLLAPAWDALVAWFGTLSLADIARGIVAAMAAPFGIFDPLSGIEGGINAAKEWLASFSLADAGANIIKTLVAGMKSMAGAPGKAMESIARDVRGYLPFSPAKVGPLRDLHKIRLVETIAETLVPGPLVAAMDRVMAGAMAPLAEPSAYMPSVVGETGGVRAAAAPAAASDARPLEVTFNLVGAGASAVAELEAWVANPSNAKRLAKAIDLVKQREAATAY
jgi:TP901 family phage tail tape measure protein